MYVHSRRTLTIASLAVLATFLDTTILFVAFPDITATFSDTSASGLSWVLNAYTIVFAALLIPAGKLADRVGHRTVFLAGSTLFTVASMACGARADRRAADRVPRRAGGRGGGVDPVVVGAGDARLRPRPAASRRGDLGRGRVPSRGRSGRPSARRSSRGSAGGGRSSSTSPSASTPWSPGARHLHESSDPTTRVPSLVGVVLIAGAAGAVLRRRSYRRVRLAQRPHARRARRRRRHARALRRPPAAHQGAGTRPRAVPHPQLQVGERRHARVRHRVRPRCSSARSSSSPKCGGGRCSRPASASHPVRSWSPASHPSPASSPAGSGNGRSSSPAASVCQQRPVPVGDARPRRQLPAATTSRPWSSAVSGSRCVFPQLSSAVARPCPRPCRRRRRRPPSRAPVRRHVRRRPHQYALLGTSGAVVDVHDRIWWIVVAGGLATSALVLPMQLPTALQPAVTVSML